MAGHGFRNNRETVPAAGLDNALDAELACQRPQPGTRGEDDGVGLEQAALGADHVHAAAGVAHVQHGERGGQCGAAGNHGFREGVHERRRVDELLVADLQPGNDARTQGGLKRTDFVTGHEVEVDLAAGFADDVKFLDQGVAVLERAESRQEGVGRAGGFGEGRCPGSNFVEGVDPGAANFRKNGHGCPPLARRAVAGKAEQEFQQRRVGGKRDVQRGGGIQHGLESVGQHRRLAQGKCQGRGQPARVAPGRARSHLAAVNHRDLDALFLQIPGSGQANDSRTNNNHMFRRLCTDHDSHSSHVGRPLFAPAPVPAYP